MIYFVDGKGNCNLRPTPFSMPGAGITVWDEDATDSASLVMRDKINNNAKIFQQISALEATCTERRWREHVMGTNTAFIPGIDAQLAALRARLK